MKVIFLSTILLVGCSTTPVPVQKVFPDVAPSLMEPAEPLKQIPPSSSSSEVFKIIVENYGQYHELSLKLDQWQRWYIEQKKIYEK